MCTEDTTHYITNDDKNENDEDENDDNDVGFIQVKHKKSYVHMIFKMSEGDASKFMIIHCPTKMNLTDTADLAAP